MRRWLVFLVGLVSLSGCGESWTVTVESVSSRLGERLRAGDGAERIESVLDAEGITHSFDEFNRRHQCIIRDPSGWPKGYHAIVIYVNVDREGRYRDHEAHDSYTAP